MLLTANMRYVSSYLDIHNVINNSCSNSCKSFLVAALLLAMAKQRSASKLAQAVMTMLVPMGTERVTAISSRGSADLLAKPPHGNVTTADEVTTMVKMEGQHLLGLQAVVVVTIIAVATISVVAVTEARLAALLHGNDSKKLLLHLQVDNRAMDMVPIQVGDMATPMATTVNQAWELLPDSAVDLAAWVLLQA